MSAPGTESYHDIMMREFKFNPWQWVSEDHVTFHTGMWFSRHVHDIRTWAESENLDLHWNKQANVLYFDSDAQKTYFQLRWG